MPEDSRAGEVIGGDIWAGIRRTVASPYLLNIALFLALFSITATFLYFEQAAVAKNNFPSRGAQTAFFANVDLAVNALTLGVQLFLTGRITRWLGVGVTLALLPAASIVGFAALALALSPSVASVVVIYVLRRAGNFAIARPVREVLFTVVPREDRYKAKSFIDTVVYRLGDQVGAWSHAGLAALGFGGHAAAVVAVPLSAAWLLNALWLGRAQARRQEAAQQDAAQQAAQADDNPAPLPPRPA
ncbi:ATP/ADP translocase [Methylorubrum pseudosasae]|nr:ATP/ADP translocase [Methylorubrum pseudosasae]